MAIWRNTGALYRLEYRDGPVGDDPIFDPRGMVT
jgi:hypothetical protein